MKNRALTPLFWVMLIDTISFTIRFPVLTLVFYDVTTRLFPTTASMATRSMWYGVCMALYWVGSIIAAPTLSAWSDYAGRKRILLFGGAGTFLFAFVTALGVIGGNLNLVLLGALIGGLCSRMDPIAQAAVGDVCATEHKIVYMSFLQLFISVGAIFGPWIGGYFAARYWFATLNFALPFIIAAAFSILGLLIMLFFFRETATHNKHSKITEYFNFKAIFANKKVINISLILILIQISWSTYYQFIAPILKKDFALGGSEIGIFMAFIAIWLALASAFGVAILRRFFSAAQIIHYASYGVFIGLLGTLFATSWHFVAISHYLMWIAIVPIAAGDVITYSAITTLYSDAVDKTMQGQVMGTSFVVVSAVWGLTSLLGGWLIGLETTAPLWFALSGVSVLIIIFHCRGWHLDEDAENKVVGTSNV